MASQSTQSHPAFPTRPYNTGKLPDRSAPLGFGASALTSARQSAQQDRERQERERQERDRIAVSQAQQAQGGSTSGNHMAQLTDEQRDEINEAFALFDLDKDNLIDIHEFKVALKALGFDLSKPDLLTLLTDHGVPSPSSQNAPQPSNQGPKAPTSNANIPPSRLHLTLQSFQTIASSLISARDPRDEILRAFNLFDTEGKGMISLEDLRRVARELGEELEEGELIAMIEEFDLEGKGGVGQEEFVQICMG